MPAKSAAQQKAACAALIAEANSARGDDNITVVLARVEDS